MDEPRLEAVIAELRRQNGRRYDDAAYYFVLEALDDTMFRLGKNRLQGESKHVTVGELMEGLRRFALEEFGPLAPFAFRSWGIRKTDDFGRIVFELCDSGYLNKRECDRLDDFRDVFDFEAAFRVRDTLQV